MKAIYNYIRELIRGLWCLLEDNTPGLFRLENDAASEEDVIGGIEAGVQFRGAKLWVLILAIFTASLGLNTNSTAVIIGAMLISPLMGPILGMGLGVGIYDFGLLRRSWKNYFVATLFSVITATCYFLITPINEAQSELLARTSPTIYDVLIALCGGLAGIIALSSRSQRAGNVIPGVAIATALMPPLCTVGYGIATAKWTFAAGALYLYVINTIFISLSTFVGAAFIMKFQRRRINRLQRKRTSRIITAIVVATVLPAIILTLSMVHENTYQRRVDRFVQEQLHFPHTHIVARHTHYDTRTFEVVLVGAEVDSLRIVEARERLADYHLDGSTLQVIQATEGMEALEKILEENHEELKQDELMIAQQQDYISFLERERAAYHGLSADATNLLEEVKTLFPPIASLTVLYGTTVMGDTIAPSESLSITLGYSDKLGEEDETRLREWLPQRLRTDRRVDITLEPVTGD